MSRPAVLAAALLAAAALPAAAQNQTVRNLDAQPGKTLRLAIAGNVGTDCKPGKPAEIKILTAPKNGSLAVRAGDTPAGALKRCPGLKVPVQGVFYEAKAGFTGSDEVSFEIVRDGKTESQTVRINVTTKPAAPAKDDAGSL
jgi:hypothetical protein